MDPFTILAAITAVTFTANLANIVRDMNRRHR